VISAILFIVFYHRKQSRTRQSLDGTKPRAAPSLDHPTPKFTSYMVAGADARVFAPIVNHPQPHMSLVTKQMPLIDHLSPTGSELLVSPPLTPQTTSTGSVFTSTQLFRSTPGSLALGKDSRFFNDSNNYNRAVAEIASVMEAMQAGRDTVHCTVGSIGSSIRREPDMGRDDDPPEYNSEC
jgi:hypothetical protein